MSTQHSAYTKQQHLDREQGITRCVDPAPATEHVRQLLERTGASRRAIAEAAGINPGIISDLLLGARKQLVRSTASALLAVQPHQLRNRHYRRGFVPKVGAVRRLRALMAIGHSAGQIAAATGGQLSAQALSNVLYQKGEWVTHFKHHVICNAYRQLATRPGNNPWTLGKARAAGWPSPLAWDENIDDPDATPGSWPTAELAGIDEIAVARAILRPGSAAGLTREERLEIIRRLAARRRPDAYIAVRAGVAVRTVLRVRQAEGIQGRRTA